jgi:protease I
MWEDVKYHEEVGMAKVAFIMDEMFEDSEFRVPYDRVREAGHEAVIVGLEKGKQLTGKKEDETVTTDVAIGDVSATSFDALVIPGGYSPDKIRVDQDMVRFTRTMVESGKPVAAVCHAGWMLAEADVLEGRTVTSWPSIKTDLKNAGAEWVDQEVVEDGNVITSRKPDDLEAFSKTVLSQIAQRS